MLLPRRASATTKHHSIPCDLPRFLSASRCQRRGYCCLAALLLLAGGLGVRAQEEAPSSPPRQKIEWKLSSDAAGGAKGAVVLDDGRILTTRTERDETGTQVVLSQSRDGGETWENAAVICRAGPDVDLGDGHLLQTRDGRLLYSYRENRFAGSLAAERSYAIRVAQSTDGGNQWTWHSDVVTSCAKDLPSTTSGGFWCSFLLERGDGTLQCYYDDEWTPNAEGKVNHQWVTMRSWNPTARLWTDPVTVARAHREGDLSRDGMTSVIETSPGQLLAVFESVAAEPPHPNVLRVARSADGGATWSWSTGQDDLLYVARGTNHMALAPWVAQQANGQILCVFVTDEDAAEPSTPGGNPSLMKIRLRGIFSEDKGATWSSPVVLEPRDRHAYMPGVLAMPNGEWLILYNCADEKSYTCLRGSPVP